MRCLICYQEAFLFRGLCEGCAPGLHADCKTICQFLDETAHAYEKETGGNVLDNWFVFESYLEKNEDVPEAVSKSFLRLFPDFLSS